MRRQPNRVRPVLVALALLAAGLVVPASSPVLAAEPAVAERAAPAVADDRLVVGLTAGTTAADAAALAAESGVRADAITPDALVVDPPEGEVAAATVGELLRDERVRFVEPNYRLSAAFVPNDPRYPSQTTLQDSTSGAIRASLAWSTTIGSRQVVVGVLDSGVDTRHPDLVGNLWFNRRGIGGCAYGTSGYNALADSCRPDDDNGHGTHVAGIVGAVGDNSLGVVGVAPRVSLMALKMLDARGDGSIAGAVEAIDWALAAKAAGVDLRVLSASWGGGNNSQALTNAITRAGQAGVLFVAAAGNTIPANAGDPVYPCDSTASNVICVAASTPDDSVAGFSHWGPQVDLAAPGVGILSTVPVALGGCGGLYCSFDGTSMAAPMVTGAAVLALASIPTLSVTALRARLLAAVEPVPSLAGKVSTGGRLDVCRVVPGCGGTGQRRPSVPQDVSVVAGPGRVTVHWGPPSSNGNGFAITGFMVTGPEGARTLSATADETTFRGLPDNRNAKFSVRAINNIGVSPPAQRKARPFSGAYVLDRAGGLARVKLGARPYPSGVTAGTVPAGARGVALLPGGTGGYTVDGTGRLHSFAVGGNARPPAATGNPSWPGQDRARGVALLPDGRGGYVLDAFGGLHRFGVGDNPRPRVARGSPSWPGWDIARGVALTPSGRGGYVVDGFGGIHRFAVGGASLPPAATAGPYWPFFDVARGIALSRDDGGGWVVDPNGTLYRFRTRNRTPARPNGGPSWPGQDRARGLAA
jgi:subtilisin family serine protease